MYSFASQWLWSLRNCEMLAHLSAVIFACSVSDVTTGVPPYSTKVTFCRGVPSQVCSAKGGTKYWNSNCENIFVWNAEEKQFRSLLNVTYSYLSSNDAGKLEGEVVRVLAQNMMPYITSSNYSQALGGFLGDIWDIIQQSLRFRSNVTSVFYDTGLDLITSGKADVMLAAAVEKEGLLNIYYSQPYFYNWYELYMKSPEAKVSSLLYVRMFHGKLWLMSLGMFALLALVLWGMNKILHIKYRQDSNISLPAALLAVSSGLIAQSFDVKLRSYSARILLTFALIFGIILCAAMNAVLVAQLAVSEVKFPFPSLRSVAEARTHSLCLRTVSFVFNNFTDERRQVLPEWRGILNADGCLDVDNRSQLAAAVCREGAVVLENRVLMNMVGRRHRGGGLHCNVISTSRRYFRTGNSFIIMKSFKHGRIIDWMMKRIRSTGILQRMESKWIRKETSYELIPSEKPPVTLDHIKGILTAYLLVIILCILLLSIECLCRKRQQRQEEKHAYYFMK